MKHAGICIILVALATASYAAPYYEGQEEGANQRDILNTLLKKMIQKKQVEAQMARYEETRSQLNDVLVKLQNEEAQQDVNDIINTILSTVTGPTSIPLLIDTSFLG
jgi:hypothetical protein